MVKESKIKNGFTMLEVAVALGVISVAMVSISTLVIQTIQVVYINKNQIIASMLAQEGLELVRQARDTNWFKGAVGPEWKDGDGGLMKDIAGDHDYIIDYKGRLDDTPDTFDNAKLYLDSNSFYYHPVTPGPGDTLTPFSRLIRIVEDISGNYIAASSTVRWAERGRTHDYVAETYLYNWR